MFLGLRREYIFLVVSDQNTKYKIPLSCGDWASLFLLSHLCFLSVLKGMRNPHSRSVTAREMITRLNLLFLSGKILINIFIIWFLLGKVSEVPSLQKKHPHYRGREKNKLSIKTSKLYSPFATMNDLLFIFKSLPQLATLEILIWWILETHLLQ